VDLISALAVLGRHWIALVSGLIVTLGASVFMLIAVPVTYQATSSDVLLVPAQPGATEAGLLNPYLGFGSGLGIVAEITARRMNDHAMGERLNAQGATADYLVDIVPGDAPLVQVTATSTDGGSALRTAKIVERALSNDLRDSQLALGSPKNLLIQTKPVTTATDAVPKRGSQIRAVAAVLVLGIAGTIFSAFTLEGLRVRRERRNAETTYSDHDSRVSRSGATVPRTNGSRGRSGRLLVRSSEHMRQ